MVSQKDCLTMAEIENPGGSAAAPGQDETDVSIKRNNIDLSDDCQSVSGQNTDFGGRGAEI